MHADREKTATTIDPYTEFATCYDYLLRHVDYQRWYEYIKTIMLNYVGHPYLILELGCGTGKFGAKFSQDGFTIFGLDKALNMLRVAKTRAYNKFKIFCADISCFKLSQKVDFIFCVHDTVNYLLEYSQIRSLFNSVKQVMKPDSIFFFDITTEFNIYNNFNEKETRYKTKDKEIIWSNRYDQDRKLVYSTLKFCANQAATTEVHVQRIYTKEEIQNILEEEGFEVLQVLGDYTFMPPNDKTVMINFITQLR